MNDSLPWLRSLPDLKRLNLTECGRPADDIDAATAYSPNVARREYRTLAVLLLRI